MPNRNPKKTIIAIVFLALLGGLMLLIQHLGNQSANAPEASPTASAPPTLDAKKIGNSWPQIVQAAAAPAKGNPNTPYTLVEFGDFECPPCGRARPILEKILTEYPTKVNLFFVYRPLPTAHKWAIASAEAAQVAANQGKFWPMYDVLYTHQDDLEPGFYKDYASQIGLNPDQFQSALVAEQGRPKVQAAAQLADSLGINSTPTILVRDNSTGTTKTYIGPKGLKDLVGNPPWSAPKTASAVPLTRP